MKITKRQLRKLIEESFVVDPKGTVYTPKTKKVHSEYGEVMGDGSIDEMDVPVVYGQDRTKQATPKLYGVITRNWHKIHSFDKNISRNISFFFDHANYLNKYQRYLQNVLFFGYQQKIF